MKRKYVDFDLAIEKTPEGYRARVLNSPTGQASADFDLPFSDLEVENFVLRLARPRSGVRRIESQEMEAAKDFGGKLFHSVFSGEVLGVLHSSMAEAAQNQTGLRIRLRLSDAPDLVDLPWEFLYSPGVNRFLSLSVDTPIVRYLDLPGRIEPLGIDPPLRVLVMISSPEDYPPLDTEQEWAKLKESLAELERLGAIVLDRMEQPTLSALQHRLRRQDYHIFHFIGHGGFDEAAQDGVLVFEDENKRSRAVSGQYLGMILHDEKTLRLAILNACDGARTSRSDPFAGVGQSLLQQGIPAVIAMQFEISDEAAITMSQEFYSALADGYPVDAALSEVRKGIFAQNNETEWATPVLYLRAPDGRIFDIATDSTISHLKIDKAALGLAPAVPAHEAPRAANAKPALTAEPPVAAAMPASASHAARAVAEAPQAEPVVSKQAAKASGSKLWLGLAGVLVLLIVAAALYLTGVLGTGGADAPAATPAPDAALVVSEPTNTATPTQTPTSTPAPTATDALPTPAPVLPSTPVAAALKRLEIRSGPGDEYEVLGYLPEGAEREIVGRDEAGEWWRIRTSEGMAWIQADPEFSDATDAGGVAIALAPPTPSPTNTPLPTDAPTPVATDTPAPLPPTPTSTPEPPAATFTPAPATPTPTPTPAVLAGKIVFPVYDGTRSINGQAGSYDIWMSNPQGSNIQRLVSDASQPQLSRDGSLLAYRSWNQTERGIIFITLGGGRLRLTSNTEDSLPSWAPDTRSLAFASRRAGDRRSRLYNVFQPGGEQSELPVFAEYVGTFPDGRLVVKGFTVDGHCGLFITGSQGSPADRITQNCSDTAPASSPDGGQIAFMSYDRDEASNFEIYVMSVAGGNITRLTSNRANDGLPAWSPDGNTIAFASDRDGQWAIWAMNSDGSNQRKLFDFPNGGSPDGSVGFSRDTSFGWTEERISWGP